MFIDANYYNQLETEVNKMMRLFKVTVVVLGMLLLSGCGDQVWCGENGCEGQKGGNITAVGVSSLQ